jgi:hypothetical protein
MISLFLILAISGNFAYAARIPWQGLLQGALASPLGNSNPQIPINNSSLAELRKRQVTSFESTCGYNTGNPDEPRTANSGFDCRIDTLHALWGFCPTTVISATDCGLAGNCVDSYSCTSGCGIFGTPSITTFTWYVVCFLIELYQVQQESIEGCTDTATVVVGLQPHFARLLC